jgi:hypothetical protein
VYVVVTVGDRGAKPFGPSAPKSGSMSPDVAFVDAHVTITVCPGRITEGVTVKVAVGLGVEPLPFPAQLVSTAVSAKRARQHFARALRRRTDPLIAL